MFVYVLSDVETTFVLDIFKDYHPAAIERDRLADSYLANGITLTVHEWEVREG